MYEIVLREGGRTGWCGEFRSARLTVSRMMRVRFSSSRCRQAKRGQVSALPAAEVKELLEWLEQHAPASAREAETAEPPA